MSKILFLEFYYNLSDVEVARQLKLNVLFRHFTGLKAEDPIPDDTSLVVFRRRLGKERFERLFDKFVKQCKDKGLLKEKLKTIDVTHIIADVAIPNTVNLLREGRKRILRSIKKEKKTIACVFKEVSPGGEAFLKVNKEDLAKDLTLSKDLIKEVKGKCSFRIEKIVSLPEKAVEPEKKRKLVSFVDPETRFGTKLAGYKAHIAKDESEIITSTEIRPGDEKEGEESNLESLLQKEDEKGLIPEAVACDALYDSLANRLNIERRGMKHYIPEKRKKKKLNEFIYNEKEDRLICRKGYPSIGKTYHKDGYVYYFSPVSVEVAIEKKSVLVTNINPRHM